MKSNFHHGCEYGLTNAGGRDHNEDAFLIKRIDDACLLAVADGLGGHAAGEVASAIAIEVFGGTISENYHAGMETDYIMNLLKDAFMKAHGAVLDGATGDRRGMGTTLVAAVAVGESIIIAHTGDSRAYIIGDKIHFRTKDHSFVQSLVDQGTLDEAGAKNHPMRSIITHSIGGDFDIVLCERKLNSEETLILCSDGLHDYVDENLLVDAVNSDSAVNGQECRNIAEKLIMEAIKTTHDNVTVVVFRDCQSDDPVHNGSLPVALRS